MEVQALKDACVQYVESLQAVGEGLAASPDDAELLELKEQLEAALQEAEAAVAGLQGPEEQAQGAAAASGAEAEAASAQAAPPAPPQAATLPRGAGFARGNARIHPRSKYAFQEPDFAALAALYPSLQPYLLPPGGGGGGDGDGEQQPRLRRASIDFTDPAACRELTRVLLRHDFGAEWWVPPGQLVPPVTNRANYILWLEDLLSLSAPPGRVSGLDIGCGANLIYPLLGAVMCGWRMVGADCTPVALEWAARNLGANPQLAGLVELRAVAMQPEQQRFLAEAQAAAAAGGAGRGGKGKRRRQQEQEQEQGQGEQETEEAAAAAAAAAAEAEAAKKAAAEDAAAKEAAAEAAAEEALACAPAVATAQPARVLRLSSAEAAGSGIVSGAVRRGERFAFCMCNPPFFESLDEAGRNPATAYGGTAAEMVYPGGELAFVTGMVQDSLHLRGAVHWYTTMVGKKSTLRAVRSLLYRHGVRALRTTELAQGKTSRWALAWSFTADAAAASQPLPRFPAAGAAAEGERQGAGSSAGPAAGLQRPASRKLSWQVHAPASAGPEVLEAMQRCLQAAGVQCSMDRGGYSIQGSYSPSAEQLAAAAAADGDDDGASGAEPASKRQRATGGGHTAWTLQLHLFMQHAGLFLLTASLHKSAPDGALAWFGGLMQQLQGALAARWKVQA